MSKVIGEGVIAERFRHLNTQYETLVFAPNSENSQVVISTQFEEESNELRRLIGLHPRSQIVYFSSCSVLDPSLVATSYVIYKKSIEELVQELAPNYLIIRLPQVLSRQSEESNLSRYVIDRVLSGEPFEIWSGAIRNFIDLDDVFSRLSECINASKISTPMVFGEGSGVESSASAGSSSIESIESIEFTQNINPNSTICAHYFIS